MKKTLITAVLLVAALCGCRHEPELYPSTTTMPTETTFAETSLSTTAAPTQSQASADSVELLLESMTIEEKVGQLFLARCPETEAISDIEQYHLGGYILFGRDFEYETPQSMADKIADYQSASTVPLLIAVDEEGGNVTRISCYDAFRTARFPSPRQLFDQGGMELVLSTEAEKCDLLRSLGININMAPVCDITTDRGAFMYSRSLGQSSEVTAQFVSEITLLMAQNGIGGVLKHFPGYGNNQDTHTGIAIDCRTLDDLKNSDLIPFAAGIDAGCGAILVSHTIVNCMDGNNPASLSPAVHTYLRDQMAFTGVIITDDLVMDAIRDQYGDGEAAVLAVLAGNDLLCSSNYPEQYFAVLDAVNSGRIPLALLDSAAERILRWKYTLGLI